MLLIFQISNAKPFRYKILIDEIGFSCETINELTFALSHVFMKGLICVEYPSSIYYANFVAEIIK